MTFRCLLLLCVAGVAQGAASITLIVGHPPESFFPEMRALLESLASTYNARQTECIVEVAPDDAAFNPDTATLDDMGDIVFLNGEDYGRKSLLPVYANKGFLVPLDDYTADPSFNAADYVKSVWTLGTFEGTCYGIPLLVRTWAIGANADYVDPASASEFNDWPKFLDYMKNTFIDWDGDGVAAERVVQTARSPYFLFEALFLAYGGDPNDPDSFRPGSKPWEAARAEVISLLTVAPDVVAPRSSKLTRFSTFSNVVQLVHNDSSDLGSLPQLERKYRDWLVFEAPGTAPLPPLDTTVVAITRSDPSREAAAWNFVKWLMSADLMSQVYPGANLMPLRRSVLDGVSDPDMLVFAKMLERAAFQLPQATDSPSVVSLEDELWSVVGQ